MLRISRDFSFEAAHFLTMYHGKCEKLHGHSYRLRVIIEGEVNANGLVLDFAILKRIVKRHILDRLDHTHLNDIIENPSAENVCLWIFEQLKNFHKLLKEEASDPNLAQEIQQYLRPEDREKNLVPDAVSDFAPVRLAEVQLWETPDSSVIFTA